MRTPMTVSAAYTNTATIVATGVQMASGTIASTSDVVCLAAQPSTANPAPSATSGTPPSSTEVTPYTATQNGARRGRSSGQGWRALPDFIAGEPFQYWPALTLPTTPEPGATSAFLPTTALGSNVVRAPMVASLPTVIGPTWKKSPSIQCPDRSTSGSMEQRCPSFSIPVTGGAECRSTPLPTVLPSMRA